MTAIGFAPGPLGVRTGAALEWVQRTVARVDCDHYLYCGNGCGLCCYDVEGGRWVKLA